MAPINRDLILQLQVRKTANELQIQQCRTMITYYKICRERLKRRVQQKRKILLYYLLLTTKLMVESRQRLTWVRPHIIGWWYNVACNLDDQAWKANFRLSKSTYDILCEKLKGILSRRNTNYRQCIPLKKKVAMCLYVLSSSSELRTIAHLFGVGKSTLCEMFHEFCDSIVSDIMPTVICYPSTESDFQKLMDDFEMYWQFPQVFGALDGCHIAVSPPKEHAVDYYCYKCFYSTVPLAFCDSEYKFTYICVGVPGRNNDANVFNRSSLSKLLRLNMHHEKLAKNICGINVGPLILADSAFPLLPNLMKSYPDGPHFNKQQKSFNYRLSRARMVIENAFGRLKARCQILGKTLEFEIGNVPKIVKACCTIHNLCETAGDRCEDEWMTVNGENEDIRKKPCTVGESGGNGNACEIRNAFLRFFNEQGHINVE